MQDVRKTNLQEPSRIAEFGCLTSRLVGVITATGGVFFLAAEIGDQD